MARNFPDPISITVPLRTTWEERWELMDEHGDPLDLTDYQFRMQVRDKATRALLLEVETEGSYATIDLLTGAINIVVPAEAVDGLSPDNLKVKGVFDAEIYIPGASEYVIPVLKGSVSLLPRVTEAP